MDARLQLSEVVIDGPWSEATPGRPRSNLRAPAPPAVVAAADEGDSLLTPPGSLGVLDRALDRLVALRIDASASATLVLVAADHPVTAHGVSTYEQMVTREVLEASVVGASLGAATARAPPSATSSSTPGSRGCPYRGHCAPRTAVAAAISSAPTR